MPSIPLAPATIVIADKVKITWDKPIENGTPVIAYTVLIKKADGGFLETSSCNGTIPAIRDAKECIFDLSLLYDSPYSLVLANKIEAKIIAHNAYGPSAESDVGGTALIVFVPSQPLSLANNSTITMGTSIGITWTPSSQVGGTPILDYEVWYDKGRKD